MIIPNHFLHLPVSVAENEDAWEDKSHTFIEVPNELVPAVRELLAKKVA